MYCLSDFLSSKTSKQGTNINANRAVVQPHKFWPLGYTIKIAFFNDVEAAQYAPQKDTAIKFENSKIFDDIQLNDYGKITAQELVKKVIVERFSPNVGLNFQFVEDYTNADIRIRFEINNEPLGILGVSQLGTDSMSQSLSSLYNESMLFHNLEISTILHEFMHALGFEHEHKNKNIQIDEKVLKCYLKSEKLDQISVGQYMRWGKLLSSNEIDYKSIMMYEIPKTIKCGGQNMDLYTISSKENEHAEQALRQNHKLSDGDIKYLQQVYPKNGTKQQFENKQFSKSEIENNFRQQLMFKFIQTSINSFFENPVTFFVQCFVWLSIFLVTAITLLSFSTKFVLLLLCLGLTATGIYYYFVRLETFIAYLKYFMYWVTCLIFLAYIYLIKTVDTITLMLKAVSTRSKQHVRKISSTSNTRRVTLAHKLKKKINQLN